MSQQIINALRKYIDSGNTKAEAVRSIADEFPHMDRQSALKSFKEGLKMSEAAANTYFYKYRNKCLKSTAPAVNSTLECNISTEELVMSLEEAATTAATWYMERTSPIDRESFMKKGGINDDGKGAVYSYHVSERTLYVGITGYRVKSRLKTPTSPHIEKAWWADWEHMRFLPLKSRSERETLEYMLILGLLSEHNQKPGFIDFETFLDQH